MTFRTVSNQLSDIYKLFFSFFFLPILWLFRHLINIMKILQLRLTFCESSVIRQVSLEHQTSLLQPSLLQILKK
jgi:hypothetical protein